MQSQVARQLGMERRRPHLALAHEHRVPVVRGQDLDAGCTDSISGARMNTPGNVPSIPSIRSGASNESSWVP